MGDAKGDREIQKIRNWDEKDNKYFHAQILLGSNNNNKIERYCAEDANVGVMC